MPPRVINEGQFYERNHSGTRNLLPDFLPD
jgi:hypothetical protein